MSEVTRMVIDYKRAPSPEKLEAIYRKMEPLLYKTLLTYSSSGLPKNILKQQLMIYLKQAIDKFVPGKGAFESFASLYIKQAYRFVNQYQHPIRLPENMKNQYSDYEYAYNYLKESLGREPTEEEIAEHSKLQKGIVDIFQKRKVNPLEEDWIGKSKVNTLKLKEAMVIVESRYGYQIRKILEEMLFKDRKLTDIIKEQNLNYNTVYPKVQQALKDVDKYLSM